MKVVLVSVLLLMVCGVTAVSDAALRAFVPGQSLPLGLMTGAAWVFAIAAFLILLRIRGAVAIVLVFSGSVAIGLSALAGPPNLSTDSARYAWDGIVQNHGVSPYAYAPAADALDRYRPDWLFPPSVSGANGHADCMGPRIEKTTTTPGGETLCTALNRPQVPTIYPPVAEGFFAAVRSFVPASAQYWPLQVAGALISLGTTTILFVGMRRHGLDARWAAVWGWSPFVAAEAVTNSHIDAVGTLIVVTATFLAVPVVSGPFRVGRAILVGIGIGLAAATKFVPAIAAPPLARRRPVIVGVAALVTFAVTYAPYVAITGWAVIGYLPGYLNEEGYDSGTRFGLLSPVLPGSWATIVAVGMILVVLVSAWMRTDPAAPWHAQTVSIGAILLITSPAYPWYALVLIPFVALSRRWEWLVVPIVLTMRPLASAHWQSTLLLFLAAVIVVTVTTLRARTSRPIPVDAKSIREETP